MNIQKCNALKTLGFKYITRDMDGALKAWKIKPVRIIHVLKEAYEDAKSKYSDADIRLEEVENEEDEYINGYHIYYCCFQRSSNDNTSFEGIYEMNKADKDFEDTTWLNSPYKID